VRAPGGKAQEENGNRKNRGYITTPRISVFRSLENVSNKNEIKMSEFIFYNDNRKLYVYPFK
jgi:hypothetical protein